MKMLFTALVVAASVCAPALSFAQDRTAAADCYTFDLVEMPSLNGYVAKYKDDFEGQRMEFYFKQGDASEAHYTNSDQSVWLRVSNSSDGAHYSVASVKQQMTVACKAL